jgi:hypothetical protein
VGMSHGHASSPHQRNGIVYLSRTLASMWVLLLLYVLDGISLHAIASLCAASKCKKRRKGCLRAGHITSSCAQKIARVLEHLLGPYSFQVLYTSSLDGQTPWGRSRVSQQIRSRPEIRQKIAGGVYFRPTARFSCDSLAPSFGGTSLVTC